MGDSTTVALPVETKRRLDRAHNDLHLTDGVPRWQTVERALQSLANDEDIALEPVSGDENDGGRRRVRR